VTGSVQAGANQAATNYDQVIQGIHGLSSEKVREYTRAGLANDWEEESSRSIAWIILKNLFIIFNLMIFPLLALLLMLGQYKDVISVGGIALLNTLINIYQEIRAKLALDRIRVEHPATTTVLRDGEIREIAVRDVVVEDHLLLGAGERVVGDAELIAVRHLEMDESMLTGESDYVSKNVGDEVLAGSFVIAGMAVARVTRLGQKAYIQKIVSFSRKYVNRRTLLERRVDILVRISMGLCFAIAGLLLVIYRPFTNDLLDPLRFIVASVTSLIPQGLVLVVTLAFALGVIAFARRGILFSRINAVESLAHIDLLCMDKTGTLTHNTIALEKIVPLAAGAEEEARSVEFLSVFAHGLSSRNKTIEALLASCNTSPFGKGWTYVDEIPFKSANKFSVVRAARGEASRGEASRGEAARGEASRGEASRGEASRYGACAYIKPEEGCTRHAPDGHGQEVFDIVFGAAEFIAPRFADPSLIADLQEKIRGYENEGQRTLILALRPASQGLELDEDTLTGLSPRALVVFSEALKEEAGEILAHFAGRGVRQVLISGDSLDTVQCIAKKLSLPGAENGMSGGELAELAKECGADATGAAAIKMRERILSCNVFARVLPEQKQAIVRAFRDAGHHVAMVGDGVNDVLALKESELSIAMGSGGSMVKDVSDIVLVNNRFDMLPGLLTEGEQIISRIRDCARVFALKNSYALLLILGTLALGMTFPFYPQQITMINFVTITLPLLYIVKFSPSRARVEPGFVWGIVKFSFSIAFLIAAASFALNSMASATWPNLAIQETLGVGWLIGRFMQNPSHYVQTLSIVPIIFMASFVFIALAYSASRRSPAGGQSAPRTARTARTECGRGQAAGPQGERDSIWLRAFPLLLSLGLCVVFFGAMYIPSVAAFFEFVPLRAGDYVLIAKVLIPALIVQAILLWLFLRRRPAGRSGVC
jgi:cation-transporting ATPase E